MRHFCHIEVWRLRMPNFGLEIRFAKFWSRDSQIQQCVRIHQGCHNRAFIRAVTTGLADTSGLSQQGSRAFSYIKAVTTGLSDTSGLSQQGFHTLGHSLFHVHRRPRILQGLQIHQEFHNRACRCSKYVKHSKVF